MPKADTAQSHIYIVLNAKFTKKIRVILSVLSSVKWKYTNGNKNKLHSIKYPIGRVITENNWVKDEEIGLGMK